MKFIIDISYKNTRTIDKKLHQKTYVISSSHSKHLMCQYHYQFIAKRDVDHCFEYC